MEFELLSHPETPNGLLEGLRRYLLNARQQMQVWGENPPLALGMLVLVLVGVELAISQRLAIGLGNGTWFWSHAFLSIGALMLAEFVLIAAASSVAGLFEKSGKPLVAFTYLNLELMPLLLLLPATLIVQGARLPTTLGLFVLVGLAMRVFSRWREVLQLVFRLSRLQTYAAMYGAVTAVGTVCAALVYIAVLGGIFSLLGR